MSIEKESLAFAAENIEQKEHGEGVEEYGEPKSWIDVLVEHADTMPHEIRVIVDKKIGSTKGGNRITSREQSQLDIYRNTFWQERFGFSFEQRRLGRQGISHEEPVQKERKIIAPETAELVGVHKDFAEHFERHVVYEDDDILVINKPAGITTQGNSSREPYSIASFIPTVRPGTAIVHRIDKETSGVLVLGKTSHIRSTLTKNWGKIEKEKWYVAIASGNYEERIIGSIFPIQETGAGARVVPERAKTSSTYFNKIMSFEKNGEPFSLLRVRIFSGRKHQIRVSLKQLGFPVVGDKLYNKTSRAKKESDRQLLHAYKLKLEHPRSGNLMEFVAPIPEDMREFIGSSSSDYLQ